MVSPPVSTLALLLGLLPAAAGQPVEAAAGGPAVAPAALEFAWSAGSLAGEAWSVDDLEARLRLDASGVGSLSLDAARLRLEAHPGRFEGLRFDCDALSMKASDWVCETGRLSLETSPLGGRHSAGWRAHLGPTGIEIEVRDLTVAAGRAALEFRSADQRWQLAVDASGLALDALAPLLRGLSPADWGATGRLSVRVDASGSGARVRRVAGEAELEGLVFASPDGTQAVEQLDVRADVRAQAVDDGWEGELALASGAGQVYAEPLYLDLGEAPLRLSCSGRWSTDRDALDCGRWSARHEGVAEASGSLRLALAPIAVDALSVTARTARAGEVYRAWLQAFLIGSPADDLTLAGAAELAFESDAAGARTWRLGLGGLDVADNRGAFVLDGIEGEVNWRREAPAAASRLTLRGGALHRVGFDGFDAAFTALGTRLKLDRPVAVPLLDGQLRLASLEVDGAATGARWQTSLALEALSLQRLTEALQWPSFTGTLEGSLPEVRFADGVLSTGEGLVFRVFDGVVELAGVTLRDPLGAVPVVAGSARLRGLDLARVTRAFAFGRIEGRIDGDLSELELVGWQPNRFRLHLYTPKQEPGRRRISQRAVENLTELGSGVPAGLSSGLLRLFEEFRYEKIDVSVALDGNLALLSGIARPDGGYYLVKGTGVPRIDVIGRNRKVAWKQLVQRLRDIRVEGVKIE
jgi:hypothetical protein